MVLLAFETIIESDTIFEREYDSILFNDISLNK
jgi:hypothetical protein